MQRKKPDVDVVLDILKETLAAYPVSEFIASLFHQYNERGNLSKKQLEGLLQKTSKVKTIPSNKIATLEAIILRKHAKHKSPLPQLAQAYVKDEKSGLLISEILEKYPTHKRVLYLKNKYDNNEILSAADLTELERFHKLLIK